MDLGPLVFFGFLGAVIIVPQVLRYKERGRLHETLRRAFERGQPVPPELLAALRWGRRRSYSDFEPPPEVMAGWTRPAAPASAPFAAAEDVEAPAAAAAPPPSPVLSPYFVSQTRRDVRRGVVWLAIGLGLVTAGAAFYAGLYEVGGAPETFSSFAALGAIPVFVGLTYLGLAWFGRSKSKV